MAMIAIQPPAAWGGAADAAELAAVELNVRLVRLVQRAHVRRRGAALTRLPASAAFAFAGRVLSAAFHAGRDALAGPRSHGILVSSALRIAIFVDNTVAKSASKATFRSARFPYGANVARLSARILISWARSPHVRSWSATFGRPQSCSRR